jgi:hypothetical protein
MSMKKIFVFDKSRTNGIALLFLAVILIFFGYVAFNYTRLGVTDDGELVALFCLILALIAFFFGAKDLFSETQILANQSHLMVKDRFSSKKDVYPAEAVEALILRKEVQEFLSNYLVLSFSSKAKPWTLFLKPKDAKFGNRIFLYRGPPSRVKMLIEAIMIYIPWQIEEDKSEEKVI